MFVVGMFVVTEPATCAVSGVTPQNSPSAHKIILYNLQTYNCETLI